MHEHRWQFLGARALWAAALAASAAQAGGIPVFDAGNFQHNMLTAMESVSQTLKQVEQYQTQLQQYENMLQNTVAPAEYLWDQAQQTMGQLRAATGMLAHYQQQAGSLEAYLEQFKDLQGYRASACFQGGCSAADWTAITQQGARQGSEAQKKANDALFRGLNLQQQAMQADARQLERLQAVAQGAGGQMQALGVANQLASHQAHQLQQLRALFLAMQSSVATRQQALADREALQLAANGAAAAARMRRTPRPLNWLGVAP